MQKCPAPALSHALRQAIQKHRGRNMSIMGFSISLKKKMFRSYCLFEQRLRSLPFLYILVVPLLPHTYCRAWESVKWEFYCNCSFFARGSCYGFSQQNWSPCWWPGYMLEKWENSLMGTEGSEEVNMQDKGRIIRWGGGKVIGSRDRLGEAVPDLPYPPTGCFVFFSSLHFLP